MKKIAIIATTDSTLGKALALQKEFPKSVVVTTRPTENENVSVVKSLKNYFKNHFSKLDGICFMGAVGACVRLMAPHLIDKQTDPAVICVDANINNVQAILSGHQGGGNALANKVAQILGGNAIISTSSDVQDIWALDILAEKFDWTLETDYPLNQIISLFVNNKRTNTQLVLF